MINNSDKFYAPLSEFELKSVKWLWGKFLGAGIITVLDGDPGVGKSYLAMNIAAEFSRGGSLPNNPKLRKRDVLYITSEDDPNFTVGPRIDAMGGDLNRIIVQKEYQPLDAKGIKSLRGVIDERRVGLIVIDTIYSFLATDGNVYNPSDIRAALSELNEIASEAECAVLLIRHLKKEKASKALYQGSGAIDVIGMARVGLVVAEHPDDPDLKVVAHSKHNLSPKCKSLSYRIIGNGDDKPPTFKWEGEIDIDANELIVGAGSNSVKDAALEFLKSELANGEKPQAEIFDAATKLNISERTLNRAKSDLNIVSRKSGKVWLWCLPTKK